MPVDANPYFPAKYTDIGILKFSGAFGGVFTWDSEWDLKKAKAGSEVGWPGNQNPFAPSFYKSWSLGVEVGRRFSLAGAQFLQEHEL